MTTTMTAMLKRELILAFRHRGEMLQPLIFLLLVVSLFPLGVGPGPSMLQKMGAGVIWIAALLSSLMGLEKLLRDDWQDGWLEQVMLCPIPLELCVLVKVTAHWLISIVPLLLLSPLLALFLNLTLDMYVALFLTLILGTPLISLVGAIGVSLTLGLNKGGILLALLLLPLFIPLLIFATSSVDAAALQLSYNGQLAFIGAMFLLALGLAPFAIAYGLRVSQN